MTMDEVFDFGLDPDEAFDPWEEDDFDLRAPHIMTVLGPIEPGDLATANAHATVALLRDPDTGHWIRSLEHQTHALQEIEETAAVGIGALIDLTLPRSGYDIAQLYEIAFNSGFQIIAATGVRSRSSNEEAALRMALDARDGIDQTGVRAGVIVADADPVDITSACDAAAITGLPVVIGIGETGLSPVRTQLERLGEPVRDRILAGIDEQPLSELQAAAAEGAFLLFDRLSGRLADDKKTAGRVVQLYEAGYGESLLLGYNPTHRRDWLSYGGGPGWPYLAEQFPLSLLDHGLQAEDARQILADNPNRAFVIRRPSASEFFE